MNAAAHIHEFVIWATFHRAPVGPYPEHTTFMLLACSCGGYQVFPRENFAITTPHFRARFMAAAHGAGWFEVS